MLTKLLVVLLGLGVSASGEEAGRFDWQERLRYYLHRTYSPQRMALLAVDAGIEHVSDEPREWGRDPQTYTYRYSAAFGRRLTRNTIELFAGAAFHEDGRFSESGASTFGGRLRHAFRQAVLARDGRFAWGRLTATATAAAITPSWYPRGHSASGVFDDIAFGYLGHLENSFITEFSPDMKRVGMRVKRKVFGKIGFFH